MTQKLTTSRLYLSPVMPADLEAHLPIFLAPETSEYSDLPRTKTEKRAKGFVAWMVRIGEQGKGFCWMMRDRSNDEVLGCIRLNSIDKRASIAEIGYELGSQYWNKGFMTEALIAVTEHSRHQMSLYRLEAWTVTGNTASNRVLEKAGFS